MIQAAGLTSAKAIESASQGNGTSLANNADFRRYMALRLQLVEGSQVSTYYIIHMWYIYFDICIVEDISPEIIIVEHRIILANIIATYNCSISCYSVIMYYDT